tara:strand:- start:2256 stop:2672 length:417 start_codon:yes stop_codon:yes gene_type:complete
MDELEKESALAQAVIKWANEHGASSIFQNGQKIINEIDVAVDNVIADDTGMNSYDSQGFNKSFLPLVIEFSAEAGNANQLALELKGIFDSLGVKTENTPTPIDETSQKLRIANYSFVEPNKFSEGTIINIHNMPEVLY